jgi:hypothetical protein
MSAQKAKKFFDSLNPQQKQFVADKTISTSLSIKNWIGFLSKASLYDRHADDATNSHNGTITASIILAIVSIFFIPVDQPWFYGVPVFLVLIAYYFYSRKKNFQKHDINNYFRLFFMPFLEMLRVKAGEEAKLSASLDFRDPKKSIPPVKSMVGSRNVQTYQAKYIIAKVSLLDGSYLEFVITDDIKVFNYRSASGKSKTKTKTVHHYFIRLSVPKNVYKLKSQSLPASVTVEEMANDYTFKLKGKQKDSNYVLLKLSVFVMGLQSLYNLVEEINAAPAIPDQRTPVDSKKVVQKKDSDYATSDSYASDSSAVPFVLWSDSMFTRSDYDSTMDRGDVPLIMDEDSKLNVFES